MTSVTIDATRVDRIVRTVDEFGVCIEPDVISTDRSVDHPFSGMKDPYPTDWLAAQTVWMLDDLTEENGATGYVLKSHTRRQPPADPKAWPEDGRLATGTRGSVVFAHGAWWHTSNFNRSDQPRSVLLGMYVATIVTPMEDMCSQLQRIEDPSETERQIMGGNQRVPVNIVTPLRSSDG